jgi:hypothetical protein
MSPLPSPRSAHRRGRITIVAIAVATCFLTFAAASLAATGSVYVDGQFNVGAGHDFFGGTTPTNGSNVGLGYSVLPNLTTGFSNTEVGRAALRAETKGEDNTASGFFALADNTTADDNTADGANALANTITGSFNTALGATALADNTAGVDNIAIGSGAGAALTTGSDNVDIANLGVAGESKAIRIGTSGTQRRTFLAGVSGTTLTGSAQPVLVKANGQLGTASASAKSNLSEPLSATVGRLVSTVKRQQRQIRRQGKEIRALRAHD